MFICGEAEQKGKKQKKEKYLFPYCDLHVISRLTHIDHTE